jgi:hypothetical protein
MSDKAIIHGVGIVEVLRERVRGAFARQDIAASEFAEFYLVNLLHQFHEAEDLLGKNGGDIFDKPLALLFIEASVGNSKFKVQTLKRLGDTALVIVGFYADRIRRTLMDIPYYVSMGSTAYRHLSGLHSDEESISGLYGELSAKFATFADVIADVAPWNRARSDSDLLKIYERWLVSGDEKLGELLKEGGINTTSMPKT